MQNIEFYSVSDSFKVVLVSLPINTVSIGIAVPVGAIHEDPHEYGIAHLLEHMIFAGTKTKTNEDIDNIIESYGASINAYTNYTETVYYLHGNGKHSHHLLAIIMDIFLNSTFPEKGLLREKDVVIEEIKGMYEETPGLKSHLTAIYTLFENVCERLRHLIGGYPDEIGKYTRQDIIDFKQRNYKEAYLIITGSFNKNKTLDYIEDVFDREVKVWKRPVRKLESKLEIRMHNNLGRTIRIENNTTQTHVNFYFRCMNDRSKWITHLGIISYILTGNLNSMLSKKLRKELRAVYSVDSTQKLYPDCGYFNINFTCNKDLVDNCIKSVWEILGELKDGQIDPHYLKVVKNLRETRNLFIFENYDNYFDIIVDSVLNGIEIPSPKKIMSRINRVTIPELVTLSKKLFSMENSLIIIEG